MTRNSIRLRSGTTSSPPLTHILVLSEYGGMNGRVLQRGLQGFLGNDPGITAAPEHFYCGDRRGGDPLGLAGGGGIGGPRRTGKGDAKPHHLLLFG